MCSTQVGQVARQAFQPTQVTWILAALARGTSGRRDVNRHLMEVYAQPLEVYVRGSSCRWAGEPMEIVHGFLADRLGRADYFEKWQRSGLPLRKWLINGLHFYLREIADSHPDALRGDGWESLLRDPSQGPKTKLMVAVDRACMATIVRQALVDAGRECERRGLGRHWQAFQLYYFRDLPFADVACDLNEKVEKAKQMTRIAREYFRSAVRELFIRDGADPEHVDDAIRSLLKDAES
ncbi:MAG TPA: hypothetical protein PKK06_06975 [Phycisphaerae bacterium]|nr:hypothetical protein [Phycisphaerae bacterium]HNU46898.1 hypothetical protein [Phycisphaerae bacterium]